MIEAAHLHVVLHLREVGANHVLLGAEGVGVLGVPHHLGPVDHDQAVQVRAHEGVHRMDPGLVLDPAIDGDAGLELVPVGVERLGDVAHLDGEIAFGDAELASAACPPRTRSTFPAMMTRASEPPMPLRRSAICLGVSPGTMAFIVSP